MFTGQAAGPVWCTNSTVLSTATLTGMSTTSNLYGTHGAIHGVHRTLPIRAQSTYGLDRTQRVSGTIMGLCGIDSIAKETDDQCRSSQVEIADAKRRKSSRCVSQIACTIAQLTFS